MKTIILITGSRSITERDKIFEKLDELSHTDSVCNLYLPCETLLIAGEAVGVDTICKDWAESRGVTYLGMPIPNEYFATYGKGAGNKRNQDMLDKALELSQKYKAEILPLAFWDGSSTGTQDMIKRINKAGLYCKVMLLGKPKTKRLL